MSKYRPGQNTVTLKLDLTGLRVLFAELGDDIEAAARPAAQAAAQVLYDDVKSNVSRLKTKTGNLARSIYQVYSDKSSPGHAIYHISWNAKKAPHGQLVEYGYLQKYRTFYSKKTQKWVTDKKHPLAVPQQVGARPFLRPAAAKAPQAYAAAYEELLRRIAERAGT